MSDDFATRLRLLRKQKNLTQAELAEMVGIHEIHLGRYERGQSRPSADILKKMADIFGISTDYLMEGVYEDALKVNLADKDLMRQFQQIEKLPESDKTVVKIFLDAFLAKKQIQEIVAR